MFLIRVITTICLVNDMDTDYYAKLSTGSVQSHFSTKQHSRPQLPVLPLRCLSTIAGMSEGVIDDSTYIECTGSFDLVTPPINCWNINGHGAHRDQGGH